MGCWHGCGPVHCEPMPRGWYRPIDEHDWYEEVNWPLRRRARARPGDREMPAASLDERLDQLREELRRVEAALADFSRQA
jgi:hypothetical protein